MAPAGFWRREVAWTLDAALLALPVLVLTGPRTLAALPPLDAALGQLCALMAQRLHDGMASAATPLQLAASWLQAPALQAAAAGLQDALWGLVLPPMAVFIPLWLAWGLAFESSGWQATPGKRLLGLRVVDPTGGRPGPWRVLWRNLCGSLSWLTLNLGHAMAALPPAHRSLHDIASGTRVERSRGSAPLPAWARAWVVFQIAVLLAAQTAALVVLQTRMLDALTARGAG